MAMQWEDRHNIQLNKLASHKIPHPLPPRRSLCHGGISSASMRRVGGSRVGIKISGFSRIVLTSQVVCGTIFLVIWARRTLIRLHCTSLTPKPPISWRAWKSGICSVHLKNLKIFFTSLVFKMKYKDQYLEISVIESVVILSLEEIRIPIAVT
jgi:hypothetical protein